MRCFYNHIKTIYEVVSVSNDGATLVGHEWHEPSYQMGVKFLPRSEKKANTQLWHNWVTLFSYLDVDSIWLIT